MCCECMYVCMYVCMYSSGDICTQGQMMMDKVHDEQDPALRRWGVSVGLERHER